MSTLHKRTPFLVWLLIALLILLALGALPAAALLIAAPDGSLMGMPLSMLEDSPFSDYLIPGMILFLVNGVYPLVVAYSLWRLPGWRWPEALNPFKQMHWCWAATLASGAMLLIWITVQVLMLGAIDPLHVLYFVWGCVLIVLALTSPVRRYCARSVSGRFS